MHKYAPRGMLQDDPDHDAQDSDSDCDDHAPLTEPISDALLGVAENRGTAVQQLASHQGEWRTTNTYELRPSLTQWTQSASRFVGGGAAV